MAKTYETLEKPADDHIEVPAIRARGASWGRHILWVLIISTALAALALLASFAFHAEDLSGRGGMTASPPSATDFNTGDRPPLAQPTQ